MLRSPGSRRCPWLLGLVVAASGCRLFGLSGPSVKIETIASGFLSTALPDSTTVRVLPGTVVLESTVTYGMPGFVIDAVATDGHGQLRVEVETRDAGDIVVVDFWFARYRLTVTGVDAGDYRLRLLWHDIRRPPSYQLRDLVDSLITVP